MIFICLVKPYDLLRTKLSVIMIIRKICHAFVVLIYNGFLICYPKVLNFCIVIANNFPCLISAYPKHGLYF